MWAGNGLTLECHHVFHMDYCRTNTGKCMLSAQYVLNISIIYIHGIIRSNTCRGPTFTLTCLTLLELQIIWIYLLCNPNSKHINSKRFNKPLLKCLHLPYIKAITSVTGHKETLVSEQCVYVHGV